MDHKIKSLFIGDHEIPLASSLHDFKSSALAEAYQDSDLTPVGVGYLEDIPALKDQRIKFFKPVIIQKNKTGYYYLRKLTRPERRAFIQGCRLSNSNIPLISWLTTHFEDLEDFIECGIVWDQTPEGWEYWNALATKARWIQRPINLTM